MNQSDNTISELWKTYSINPIAAGPTIHAPCNVSTSGDQDTSHLPFPGGWYSDTDIKNNPYGGNYTYQKYYDKTLNKDAYALNVVPDFQNNSWIFDNACNGNPNLCSPNTINTKLPYNLYPKVWTGYITSNDKSTNNGIDISPPTNQSCPGYYSGYCKNNEGLTLCSTDTQMSINSCPGATGMFALKNRIYIAETTDYHNVSTNEYPRGMGTCIYPADIISDDNDLINLMALRNTNMIHPELADILGLNYCYSPVQLGPGQGCGFNSDRQLIQDCNVYYYDKNSPNKVVNSPCVQLVDRLTETYTGKRLLNKQNNQWCNDINHTYNPLCDCIKADVNNGPNGPIPARSAYKDISDLFIPGVQDTIPKKCWFTPCTTYAMPIYDTTPCPETNVSCTNITVKDGKSVIDHNNQYVNCVNGPSGGGEIPPRTINFLVIFLIIFVIGIVIFLIAKTKSNSIPSFF